MKIESILTCGLLAATRLSYAEGRPAPRPFAIDVHELVGDVFADFEDPTESDDR